MRSTLIALVASALAVSAALSLLLKVSAPESFAPIGVEELKIVTTLINSGTEILKLLRDPRTTLSNAPTETFQITNAEGQAPAFKGIKVKYVPNVMAKVGNEFDFAILAPGASIEVTHNLADTYNFEKSGAGAYEFEASTLFRYVDAAGSVLPIYADAETTTVALAGSLNKVKAAPTLGKRIAYVGCTAARQTLISAAASSAQSYSSAAASYITSHTTTSTRYVSWFGVLTAARRSTVLNHFTALTNNPFSAYTYDCSTCTLSAYAYVYPDQYGKIYLCSAFWSAPATGTDSKAGTLVHESSHFTLVAGTDDVVYGQSGARALAKSNPASAITNADSHEYFAENTPAESQRMDYCAS